MKSVLLCLVTVLLTALPSLGQTQTLPELTQTPDDAAILFLRSVRGIRWGAAAQFTHPQTLQRFHELVTVLADVDSTGAVRRYLSGTDSDGYGALTSAEVFERSLGATVDDMPGLMHAVFDRDDHVLGHVLETPDTAHAVYRTTPRISGGVSQVKVMQLARTPDGWRVLWSDELEVLDAALRGVPRMFLDPRG